MRRFMLSTAIVTCLGLSHLSAQDMVSPGATTVRFPGWTVTVAPLSPPVTSPSVNEVADAEAVENSAELPPAPSLPETPAVEAVDEPAVEAPVAESTAADVPIVAGADDGPSLAAPPMPTREREIERLPVVIPGPVMSSQDCNGQNCNESVMGEMPVVSQLPPALLAGQYAQVYASIPFLRTEYDANPAYRHEATMEILLGQPRPASGLSATPDYVQPPIRYRLAPRYVPRPALYYDYRVYDAFSGLYSRYPYRPYGRPW